LFPQLDLSATGQPLSRLKPFMSNGIYKRRNGLLVRITLRIFPRPP
jgi:hypothetical protein